MDNLLLGLQIVLSVLCCFGGFRLLLFGWANLADEGLKRVFNRQGGGVVRIVAGFCLAYTGATISALSMVYWLVR